MSTTFRKIHENRTAGKGCTEHLVGRRGNQTLCGMKIFEIYQSSPTKTYIYAKGHFHSNGIKPYNCSTSRAAVIICSNCSDFLLRFAHAGGTVKTVDSFDD